MTLTLHSLKIPGTKRLSLPPPSDLFCGLMERGRRIKRLREREREEERGRRYSRRVGTWVKGERRSA